MTGPSRRARMPLAVGVAVGALVVVVAVQATLAILYARPGQAGWAMYAAFVALFAALVVGLVRGARLAWLWGRYLTLLLAVVVAANLVAAAGRKAITRGAAALGLAGLALPLAAAGVALGRRSAFGYFDLVCPSCGATTGLGNDLRFHEARCRKCGHVW